MAPEPMFKTIPFFLYNTRSFTKVNGEEIYALPTTSNFTFQQLCKVRRLKRKYGQRKEARGAISPNSVMEQAEYGKQFKRVPCFHLKKTKACHHLPLLPPNTGGKKKKSQQKMDREARLSRPQIKRLALIKMLRNTSM